MAKTIFWVASILSVLLLATYTLSSTSVTQYNPTDLGLLSKLPITFWIGLLVLGGLLYLSTKFERRKVFVAIIVVLISFYLFGIPVLIRENKADGISYWLVSKGADLTSEVRVDFSTIYPWDFFNWPGFFFNVAFLSSVTGLPATVFADYFPLLTMVLLGIITYSLLRLRLSALYSSLGALWVIASSWTGQNYFSPQSAAYVMYFAILLLLAKFFSAKKRNIAFPLSILFLFIGAVITHLLTSFVIVAGLIVVYALHKIFHQKVKTSYLLILCLLLLILFFSYQTIITQNTFNEITKTLYSQIMQQETPIAVSLQSRAGGSTSLLLTILGDYSITIINAVIGISAILVTALGLLFHKKEVKNDLFWIAWIVLAGILSLSLVYGAEAINRAFIFMLLPTSYFAIRFLSKKPAILILVLIALTFINIPAQYSSQNYTYLPSTELKGTTFYANSAPHNASKFYEPLSPFLPYGKTSGRQISLAELAGLRALPSQELINWTISQAQFIISSNTEKNLYAYFYGIDPLENLSLVDQNNRLYDNEGFQIYAHPSE